MTRHLLALVLIVSAVCAASLTAEPQGPPPATPTTAPQSPPLFIGGASPQIAIVAGHANRSEAGIGALLPWADRLWFVGYVAHKAGEGIGLYWLDESLTLHKHPASVVGTFTNRYIHNPSNQAFIGPYVIDTAGNVRVIDALKTFRLTSVMTHLTDQEHKSTCSR